MGTPMVVKSEALAQLMVRVEKVAQTNAAVLITGESGTGKELIARAIHQYSSRSDKPWVDINCAALPDHLVESELFGHEKGAFTGAGATKKGLFELADGGTLFLDEIGELDLRMQAKLLRVLDGTSFYRLGGVRKSSIDVRIVAATNQSLEETVSRREFREDLYHRLNQVHLEVPPLRQRPEDIEALAVWFLHGIDSRLRFSAEALRLLRSHSWPGNVRELRNVVTTAAIFAEELDIQPSHFPPEIADGPTIAASSPTLRLESVERVAIFHALAQTGGRQDRAAELLGISRRTLIRKLKLYRSKESMGLLHNPETCEAS